MHIKRLFAACVVGLALGTAPSTTFAQTVGSCQATTSTVALNVNGVQAGIHNDGNLFHGYGYWIGEASSLFSAHFLIMGLANGEYAGALGNWNFDDAFFAGPVYPGVTAPPDCFAFDHIYKVNREDIIAYDVDGTTTADLLNWPTGLGAPTVDANGNRIELQGDGTLAHIDAAGTIVEAESLSFEERLQRKIDLQAGERPEMLGDQMLWWVMNDLGSPNRSYPLRQLGLEVHGTAFGFNVPGSIGNTTFYKFKVYHKGVTPLEDAYVGMFFDSDLGWYLDDYVGVDTTLGLGYFYNADNDDEYGGYGENPPAIGVDFFQGPLVDSDGIDNDRDGSVDESGERLQMTSFLRAVLIGESYETDPAPKQPEEYYNVMRGLWKDGIPVTIGGVGRNFGSQETPFQFPGAAERGEFWSQINTDGQGTPSEKQDTRFNVSSGPIRMDPGDVQEIVFGILWSRGNDHLDSVRRLKEDDILAQALFDIGFALPAPPAAPRLSATPLDGRVILDWSYLPSDNNYLDAYYAIDPLLSDDVADNDYQFEGYRVFQFTDPSDGVGKVLATYDVPNGITRVIEGGDLTFITADGKDSGLQHSYVIEELTNYQTYFFGVQAYAYNAESRQKVFNGPIAKVEVIPTRIDARDNGSHLLSDRDVDLEGELVLGTTDGLVGARIINPAAVTGHDYRVVFREDTLMTGNRVVTYDINDYTTGEVLHDGTRALREVEKRRSVSNSSEWVGISQHERVLTVDGLEFDILGPTPDFKWFYVTHNADGPLETWTGGAADWAGFPVPARPGDEQQASNNSNWLLHTGGNFNSFDQFVGRVARNDNFSRIVPYDWEMRFTGTSTCWPFSNDYPLIEVPFELWRAGINTPLDTSDDTRLSCLIVEGLGGGTEFDVFDIGDDSPLSSNPDDPYSDWIYWVLPADDSPGDSGYQVDVSTMLAGNYSRNPAAEVMARTVLVNWNGGAEPPYTAVMPEPGTVFRIETTKPNGLGTVFSVNTAGFEKQTGVASVALNALDQIGISPNPYLGASDYEVNRYSDEVRFTNMPPRATVRVFDLAGSLVRRLEKSSSDPYLRWDLRTDENLPIASGIYFIHVTVPDLGERAFKFSVVRKGTRY